MLICAVLLVLGGVVSWFTIRNAVLEEQAPGNDSVARSEPRDPLTVAASALPWTGDEGGPRGGARGGQRSCRSCCPGACSEPAGGTGAPGPTRPSRRDVVTPPEPEADPVAALDPEHAVDPPGPLEPPLCPPTS